MNKTAPTYVMQCILGAGQDAKTEIPVMMSQLKHTLCQRLLVWLFGLMVAVPLWAGEPQRDKTSWNKLQQLVTGQTIKIVLMDAKSYSGEYQSRTDEAIVVRLATGELTFSRQSVLRVSSKGQSHRWRNVAIGAAIGAGLGAGIGAAAPGLLPGDVRMRNAAAAAVAVLGSAGGAAVGAALPTGGWHDVYRARAR